METLIQGRHQSFDDRVLVDHWEDVGGLEEDAHGAPYRHHQEGHQQEAVNDAGHVLPVVDDLNNKRPEITKVDAWNQSS